MACKCRSKKTQPQGGQASAPSSSRVYVVTTTSGETLEFKDRVKARATQIVKGGTLKVK